MPAGFSGLDFYYILPELVLTGGHLSSLERLRHGSIQVASIDSNVHRSHAGALDGLRVVDSGGPVSYSHLTLPTKA